MIDKFMQDLNGQETEATRKYPGNGYVSGVLYMDCVAQKLSHLQVIKSRGYKRPLPKILRRLRQWQGFTAY